MNELIEVGLQTSISGAIFLPMVILSMGTACSGIAALTAVIIACAELYRGNKKRAGMFALTTAGLIAFAAGCMWCMDVLAGQPDPADGNVAAVEKATGATLPSFLTIPNTAP